MGNDSWNRRQIRKLVERVGRLERTQNTDREIASGPEDWHLEDGALYIYDDDGNLRTRVGKQNDGTYTSRDFRGPIPPRPSQPEVKRRTNGLVVTWDGIFKNEDDAPPRDFRYMAVHASTDPTFTPTFQTERATIVSEDGGQAFISLPAGTWHVALETVTTSYRRSQKSIVTTASPLRSYIEFANETFDAAVGASATSMTLTREPLDNSEHVYWRPAGGAGVYLTGSSWSRAGKVVTVPASPVLVAGDKFTVEYAYLADATAYASVPLGAVWRYQRFPNTPSAGSATLAQPSYDDSAWLEDVTPFVGAQNESIWTRRRVTTKGGTRLRIRCDYIDDRSNVYLDGTLIWSPSWQGYTPAEIYTGTLAAGEHLIAANVWNVGTGGMEARFEIYEEVAP